jgi:hypothetical protein
VREVSKGDHLEVVSRVPTAADRLDQRAARVEQNTAEVHVHILALPMS